MIKTRISFFLCFVLMVLTLQRFFLDRSKLKLSLGHKFKDLHELTFYFQVVVVSMYNNLHVYGKLAGFSVLSGLWTWTVENTHYGPQFLIISFKRLFFSLFAFKHIHSKKYQAIFGLRIFWIFFSMNLMHSNIFMSKILGAIPGSIWINNILIFFSINAYFEKISYGNILKDDNIKNFLNIFMND